jgi:hypothetical protein
MPSRQKRKKAKKRRCSSVGTRAPACHAGGRGFETRHLRQAKHHPGRSSACQSTSFGTRKSWVQIPPARPKKSRNALAKTKSFRARSSAEQEHQPPELGAAGSNPAGRTKTKAPSRTGQVAERPIAPVSKMGGPKKPRGFKSHPVRQPTTHRRNSSAYPEQRSRKPQAAGENPASGSNPPNAG